MNKWPIDIKSGRIDLNEADILQECDYTHPFRASTIFPLTNNFIKPSLDCCYIYFYSFFPAFSAIGRIRNRGSEELKRRTWYTIGLASVLLITEKSELDKELLDTVGLPPHSVEVWSIEKTKIADISCKINAKADYNIKRINVHKYKSLPVTAKAIVDEFVANIALITPKVALNIPNGFEIFVCLVEQVNELIDELEYLYCLKGKRPETLSEYTKEILTENSSVRETIIHQDLDRLIQINAALSYFSTQAVSGAIPILERRSLIRRNSLLGVGTAIISINNLIRSIEQAFSENPIEDIIEDRMNDAGSLRGLEDLPDYNPSGWTTYSVDHWADKIKPRKWYSKLPYYSGRLGFREAEHAISVAIQTLTGGASLEWSLLTVTHEILHGHIRKLLATIFQGDKDKLPEEKRKEFYQRYEAHVYKRQFTDETQLDSLRNIILAYCCRTITNGSLTKPTPQSLPTEDGSVREIQRNFWLPDPKSLWQIFENEYRNISEIWVHILDLHYFYGSRVAAYIPLIWQSWTPVPHVKGDLRQYILRSLLTISTKAEGTPYERFKICVNRMKELMEEHLRDINNAPLIQSVVDYMNDEKLVEDMFEPFTASLILVDLVNNILLSQNIRGTLLDDPLIRWVQEGSDFEEKFEYNLPEGFVEEKVQKPAAYLLDRIIRRLQAKGVKYNLEAETAMLFLACSSYLDEV